MRKFRMWYGLAIIWVTRYVKMVVRKIGESMKTYGRKLEHMGDDVTPRWSRELFYKCYHADAEIHLGSKVIVGRVDSIYQEYSGKDSLLVVKLKERAKRVGIPPVTELLEDCEFKLIGYGPPVVIKEDGCNCVWTGHKNGYLAIFFR
ncbi:MAG: hypothetical protein WBC83_00710 [Minisyncoccia bacterium]